MSSSAETGVAQAAYADLLPESERLPGFRVRDGLLLTPGSRYHLPMFDDVKQALHDLLHGNVAPADRRQVLQDMRETMVRSRMALEDLREGVRQTERRLERERAELETVRRRKSLAEGVGDADTVTIATRFETQHHERVTLLEKRLDVEQGELSLVERDIEEMTTQFKAAQAGVGSGFRSGSVPAADPSNTDDPLDSDAALNSEISGLGRAQRRAHHEADADARLAELKRRMGL